MRTVSAAKFAPGKVIVGPRAVGEAYYRIVAQRDRTGRIEVYDARSKSWSAAPDAVTFDDVWKARPVSQWLFDLACASGADGDDLATEANEPEAEPVVSA